MARSWEMSPVDAQAGDPGPLRIFDLGDGPEGRAVCILPGSTARQAQDSTLQRGARRPGPRQRDRDHARAAHAGGVCGARAVGHAHGRLGCRVLALRRGRRCTPAPRP